MAKKWTEVPQIYRTDLDRLTPDQKEAWSLMDRARLTILLGPAGTGKTEVACLRALHELLTRKSVQRIVMSRPAVEAGEKLGFLPGNLKEKVDPYLMPLYDCLDNMVGKDLLRAQVDAACVVSPLAFMRGRTFKHSINILDEAQNCTYNQLKLFATRIGRGSKSIITGDPDQSDLNGDALLDFAEKLEGVRGVAIVDLTHIIRDPMIADILEALK